MKALSLGILLALATILSTPFYWFLVTGPSQTVTTKRIGCECGSNCQCHVRPACDCCTLKP